MQLLTTCNYSRVPSAILLKTPPTKTSHVVLPGLTECTTTAAHTHELLQQHTLLCLYCRTHRCIGTAAHTGLLVYTICRGNRTVVEMDLQLQQWTSVCWESSTDSSTWTYKYRRAWAVQKQCTWTYWNSSIQGCTTPSACMSIPKQEGTQMYWYSSAGGCTSIACTWMN